RVGREYGGRVPRRQLSQESGVSVQPIRVEYERNRRAARERTSKRERPVAAPQAGSEGQRAATPRLLKDAVHARGGERTVVVGEPAAHHLRWTRAREDSLQRGRHAR